MKRLVLVDDQYQNIAPFMAEGMSRLWPNGGAMTFEAVPFPDYFRVRSLEEYDRYLDEFFIRIPEDEKKDTCVLLDWVFIYNTDGVNKSEWHGLHLFEKLLTAGFENVIIFSNYTEDSEFRRMLLKNGLCIAKPPEDLLEAFVAGEATTFEHLEAASYFTRLRLMIQSLFFDEELERYGMILGNSPKMSEVRELIDRAAESDVNVLILGETGTGKELTARAIHSLSVRGARRFLAINCSGIPADLLETELYGYSPGTFTDQVREGKRGLLREADGGTILLDEIGDMPLLMQAKLLRFLQDHKVRPVGSTEEHTVDVRIMCSTHRDLRSLMRENVESAGTKGFRSDLFWRIRVLEIELQPLRERLRTDEELVFLLFFHFLRRAFRKNKIPRIADLELSDAAMRSVLSYDWPGNFREFENVVLGATTLLGPTENTLTHTLLERLMVRPSSQDTIQALCSSLESGRTLADVPLKYQRAVLSKFIEKLKDSGNRLRLEDLVGVVLGEPKDPERIRLRRQTARVSQYLHRHRLSLTRSKHRAEE